MVRPKAPSHNRCDEQRNAEVEVAIKKTHEGGRWGANTAIA